VLTGSATAEPDMPQQAPLAPQQSHPSACPHDGFNAEFQFSVACASKVCRGEVDRHGAKASHDAASLESASVGKASPPVTLGGGSTQTGSPIDGTGLGLTHCQEHRLGAGRRCSPLRDPAGGLRATVMLPRQSLDLPASAHVAVETRSKRRTQA
jgi:hypothetical protein